jgi:hypothetical protein
MPELDDWATEELTRLEQTILWIQDAVGQHFPWCDACLPDQHLPCSCGMDAMRENRAFIVAVRQDRVTVAATGGEGTR